MLPAIIAGIGIPALAELVSSALNRINNPVAKGAAKALEDLGAAIGSGAITPDQIAEANRHAEAMAQLDAGALAQVNESLRTDVSSTDPYVRRMRPTFGYFMAVTWAAQMLGLAYVIVFRTAQAPAVFNAMSSLSIIWTVGLSVLGVYVYKRSEEKKAGI